MTPRERVLCALSLGEPDRVPYCELTIDESIAAALLGHKPPRRIELVYNRTAEEEKRISELLGRDNICFYLDAPFFAEFAPGEGGRQFYVDGLIRSEDDLDKLKLPDPFDKELYRQAMEFVKQKGEFAACLHVRLCVGSAMISMGIERFCYSLYDNPSLVHEVLRRYGDWSKVVVERAAEIGFDFIWASDDMAFKTGPFFSPSAFRTHILPYLRRVAQSISIPWIHHSDGNLMPILDDWLSLGMNGIHPIEPGAMDIGYLKEHYGRRVCLVGNIDIDLLASGTPEQVEAEVRAKIADIAPGGGYIISSSNCLTEYVRLDNVYAMSRAVRQYGRYPISIQ